VDTAATHHQDGGPATFTHGGGHLEWYIRRTKGKRAALRALEVTGATVVQDGDGEAAGCAPVTAIESINKVIQPFKRKDPAIGRARGAKLTAGMPT
jgi:hypothetical protein